jgi:hypothetical protein
MEHYLYLINNANNEIEGKLNILDELVLQKVTLK